MDTAGARDASGQDVAARVPANVRAMCHAVVSEMHLEIGKHNLRADARGEDDIYETVPAICLGVVQTSLALTL